LDRLVIDAGHLDRDDGVGQSLGLAYLGDILHHPSQVPCGMLNGRGFEDHFAVEVAKHPF
jgi:hypothetical protein